MSFRKTSIKLNINDNSRIWRLHVSGGGYFCQQIKYQFEVVITDTLQFISSKAEKIIWDMGGTQGCKYECKCRYPSRFSVQFNVLSIPIALKLRNVPKGRVTFQGGRWCNIRGYKYCQFLKVPKQWEKVLCMQNLWLAKSLLTHR